MRTCLKLRLLVFLLPIKAERLNPPLQQRNRQAKETSLVQPQLSFRHLNTGVTITMKSSQKLEQQPTRGNHLQFPLV